MKNKILRLIFSIALYTFLMVTISCTVTNRSTENENTTHATVELNKNYQSLSAGTKTTGESIVFCVNNQPLAEIIKNNPTENYSYQEIQMNSSASSIQKTFKKIYDVLPESVRKKLKNKMIFRVFPQFKELIKNLGNQNPTDVQSSISTFLRSGKNWLSLKRIISQISPLSIGFSAILLYFMDEINNSLKNIQQSLQELNRNFEIENRAELDSNLLYISEYIQMREANIQNSNPLMQFKKAIQLDVIRKNIYKLYRTYMYKMDDKIINYDFERGFLLETRINAFQEYLATIGGYVQLIFITLEAFKNIMYLKSDFETPQEILIQIKSINDIFLEINNAVKKSSDTFNNNIKKVCGLISFSSTDNQEQKKLLNSCNSLLMGFKTVFDRLVSEIKGFKTLITKVKKNNYLIELTFDNNKNLIRIRRMVKTN